MSGERQVDPSLTDEWTWSNDHALPDVVDVAVIGGSRDEKFAALGTRLAGAIPRASLRIVSGAGHAIPRQAPGGLAAILSRSL